MEKDPTSRMNRHQFLKIVAGGAIAAALPRTARAQSPGPTSQVPSLQDRGRVPDQGGRVSVGPGRPQAGRDVDPRRRPDHGLPEVARRPLPCRVAATGIRRRLDRLPPRPGDETPRHHRGRAGRLAVAAAGGTQAVRDRPGPDRHGGRVGGRLPDLDITWLAPTFRSRPSLLFVQNLPCLEQLSLTVFAHGRITKFELLQRVENDARHGQSREPFVVGGNNVPRRHSVLVWLNTAS